VAHCDGCGPRTWHTADRCPSRLDGVDTVRLDETACQAASATQSRSFVTGIVDLTRDGAPARLLDVVDDRSASALVSWMNQHDPERRTGIAWPR
jgi:hypothetical protein